MELKITGIDPAQRENFLENAQRFLDRNQGALRLSKVADKKNRGEILFLRKRTWGEFFLEKLILTPQEMEDIQNEALAAIELAFFSFEKEVKWKAQKESGKGEENFVHCLDDSDNKVLSEISDESSLEEASFCINAEFYKSSLRSRVLDKADSEDETESTRPDFIKTSNGLLTVPKGISVSTCPALQVISHNVVVSSVGAVSVGKVSPYSPLQRAVDAFKSVWSDSPIKTLPICRKENILLIKENLMPKTGLRHIQKLVCIPDDRKRHDRSALAGKKKNVWETLYESLFSDAVGSVVLELYPDYYEDDKKALGKRKPFYSEENIRGAVDAAIKVRKEMRKNKKELVSIMFAGMEQDTFARVCNELKKRASNLND